MRIVIAEDTVLLREGLAGLLQDAGHEVVARAGDAGGLLAAVAEHEPDLAIVDVRMPPTYEDEGMVAAAVIRERHPGTAVLVLSQHVETRHAVGLVSRGGGFGYLLKDRVLDVDDFFESCARVAAGGTALDPTVVATLVAPPVREDPLAELTAPRARGARARRRGGAPTPASPGASGSPRRPSRPTSARSCASSASRPAATTTAGCSRSWPSCARPRLRASPEAGSALASMARGGRRRSVAVVGGAVPPRGRR